MAVQDSSLANSPVFSHHAKHPVNAHPLSPSQGIKKIFVSGGGLVFTKKLSFCLKWVFLLLLSTTCCKTKKNPFCLTLDKVFINQQDKHYIFVLRFLSYEVNFVL